MAPELSEDVERDFLLLFCASEEEVGEDTTKVRDEEDVEDADEARGVEEEIEGVDIRDDDDDDEEMNVLVVVIKVVVVLVV